MLDLLGSEYGWTPEYILWTMSRAEIEAIVAAIGRRYDRRAAAIDRARSGHRPSTRTPHVDAMTPDQIRSALGIPVNQVGA